MSIPTITFRLKKEALRLLELEMAQRPGVPKTYLLNEIILKSLAKHRRKPAFKRSSQANEITTAQEPVVSNAN